MKREIIGCAPNALNRSKEEMDDPVVGRVTSGRIRSNRSIVMN